MKKIRTLLQNPETQEWKLWNCTIAILIILLILNAIIWVSIAFYQPKNFYGNAMVLHRLDDQNIDTLYSDVNLQSQGKIVAAQIEKSHLLLGFAHKIKIQVSPSKDDQGINILFPDEHLVRSETALKGIYFNFKHILASQIKSPIHVLLYDPSQGIKQSRIVNFEDTSIFNWMLPANRTQNFNQIRQRLLAQLHFLELSFNESSQYPEATIWFGDIPLNLSIQEYRAVVLNPQDLSPSAKTLFSNDSEHQLAFAILIAAINQSSFSREENVFMRYSRLMSQMQSRIKELDSLTVSRWPMPK